MMKNILGTEHTEYTNPIERFANLSTWALTIINKLTDPKIFIEGYSFGSKGQAVFQIAENTGLLKYKIYQTGIPNQICCRNANCNRIF